MRFSKKLIAIAILCSAVIFARSYAQNEHHEHHEEKATNLQVLPKDISGDELMKIMHVYSTSLGVHCNYCHVSEKVEGREHPKMDFASDKNENKDVARYMMRMTDSINKQFFTRAGEKMSGRITCMTCHNGKPEPVASADELMKK